MRRTGVPRLCPRFPALVLVAAGLAAGCAAADRDDERPAELGTEIGETLRYECDGGGTLLATYPSDSTVVVRHDGRSLNLRRAVSASGARYVGDGFEWWTRGRGVGAEGTLSRADGAAEESPEAGADPEEAEPLATCRESSAMRPGSAPQA